MNWLVLAIFAILIYALCLRFINGEDEVVLFGRSQLFALTPIVFIFGFLAYECRWDGISRKRDEDEDDDDDDFYAVPSTHTEAAPEASPAPEASATHEAPPAPAAKPADVPTAEAPRSTRGAPPDEPELEPLPSSPSRAWYKAMSLTHASPPDPKVDGNYLRLVYYAAEAGHLEALVALSEFAHMREALVEAFFWMEVAVRKGHPEAEEWLHDIIDDWVEAAAPCEYENVYDHFSERRGDWARAHLRLAAGIDVGNALRELEEVRSAAKDDPLLK